MTTTLLPARLPLTVPSVRCAVHGQPLIVALNDGTRGCFRCCQARAVERNEEAE